MNASKVNDSESFVWPPQLSSVQGQSPLSQVPSQPEKENYFKKLDFLRLERERLEKSKEYESNFFRDIENEDISDQYGQCGPDEIEDSLQESIDQTRREYRGVQEPSEDSEFSEECEYCGAVDPRFRKEEFSNAHLIKDCMLVLRCENCGSITEVWELTQHLLQECKHRNAYQQCRNCGLAVLAASMPTHKIIGCQPRKSPEIADRCQLCQRDIIPPEKESWRRHMLNGLCSGHDRLR
jgi:hypothetical protein